MGGCKDLPEFEFGAIKINGEVLKHKKQCWCCSGFGRQVEVEFLCWKADTPRGPLAPLPDFLMSFNVTQIDSCNCKSCPGADADVEYVGSEAPFKPSYSL